MKIEGKNVIVTGGASGLGKATVEDLCSRNCKVILADLKTSNGEQIVIDLVSQGYKVLFFPTDVSSEENIIEMVKFAIQEFQEIHILVNCAGKAHLELTLKDQNNSHSMDTFKNLFEINVFGTFYASKHVGFQMIKQQKFENGIRGVIVNVSSITAEEGPPGLVAYASTKGALNGMALPMARDLGFFGIRIVTIAPGLFETQMTQFALKHKMLKMSNVSERPGNSKEFSHFALGLIENDYVTGTISRIDGGDKVLKK